MGGGAHVLVRDQQIAVVNSSQPSLTGTSKRWKLFANLDRNRLVFILTNVFSQSYCFIRVEFKRDYANSFDYRLGSWSLISERGLPNPNNY